MNVSLLLKVFRFSDYICIPPHATLDVVRSVLLQSYQVSFQPAKKFQIRWLVRLSLTQVTSKVRPVLAIVKYVVDKLLRTADLCETAG